MQMSPFQVLEDVAEEEIIHCSRSSNSSEIVDPFQNIGIDEYPTIVQNDTSKLAHADSSITKDVALFLQNDNLAIEELKLPAQQDQASISILPDEEQQAFEDKMDMYLLGDQVAPNYVAD